MGLVLIIIVFMVLTAGAVVIYRMSSSKSPAPAPAPTPAPAPVPPVPPVPLAPVPAPVPAPTPSPISGTPNSVASSPFSSPGSYTGPRVSGVLQTQYTNGGISFLSPGGFASVSSTLTAGTQFYLTGISPFGTFNPRITYTVQSYTDPDDPGLLANGWKIMNYLPNDSASKLPSSKGLYYTTGPYVPRPGALSTDIYGAFPVHYLAPGVIQVIDQFEADFLYQNLPINAPFTISSITPPPATGFNYDTVFTMTSIVYFAGGGLYAMIYTPPIALPDNSIVNYVRYVQAPTRAPAPSSPQSVYILRQATQTGPGTITIDNRDWALEMSAMFPANTQFKILNILNARTPTSPATTNPSPTKVYTVTSWSNPAIAGPITVYFTPADTLPTPILPAGSVITFSR